MNLIGFHRQKEDEMTDEYSWIGAKLTRLRSPDGDCTHCGQAADQHRPVGPITVKISEPDEGETFVCQFCNWRCLGHWAAVQAGGSFIVDLN
jgi:hypothetical protein